MEPTADNHKTAAEHRKQYAKSGTAKSARVACNWPAALITALQCYSIDFKCMPSYPKNGFVYVNGDDLSHINHFKNLLASCPAPHSDFVRLSPAQSEVLLGPLAWFDRPPTRDYYTRTKNCHIPSYVKAGYEYVERTSDDGSKEAGVAVHSWCHEALQTAQAHLQELLLDAVENPSKYPPKVDAEDKPNAQSQSQGQVQAPDPIPGKDKKSTPKPKAAVKKVPKAQAQDPNDPVLQSMVAKARASHLARIESHAQKQQCTVAARIVAASARKKNYVSIQEFEAAQGQREAHAGRLAELQAMLQSFDTSAERHRAGPPPEGTTTETDVDVVTNEIMMREVKRLGQALPTYAVRHELVDLVASHRAVVVVGGTGCGKSTQIVQYLADSRLGQRGTILCTEPRAMSARALWSRVGEEYGRPASVGINLPSFNKNAHTARIVFSTDAVMCGRMSQKQGSVLNGVSVLVIDEAHERTLDTDLLLGFAKEALNTYPHLRLVVTSATIDEAMFSRYFNGCPVVRVPGTLHPVEVRYAPEGAGGLLGLPQREYCQRVVAEVVKIITADEKALAESGVWIGAGSGNGSWSGPRHAGAGSGSGSGTGTSNGVVAGNPPADATGEQARAEADFGSEASAPAPMRPGQGLGQGQAPRKKETEPRDILVFMPGQDDCEMARDMLLRRLKDAREVRAPPAIHTLHGGVDIEERMAVLSPAVPGNVRVVIATNAAETSVTIDGVVHVVDTGLMKEAVYDSLRGMEVLQMVPVPKTSADQRKGRAGRTRPGVCHRLYSRRFYESEMEDYGKPEVQRKQITKMVLYLKERGVKSARDFDFIERPAEGALEGALAQLRYLGALDEDEGLTEVGRVMAKLPTDPCTSKMLLEGEALGVLEETVQLAAILSTCSIMFRTVKRQPKTMPMPKERGKGAHAQAQAEEQAQTETQAQAQAQAMAQAQATAQATQEEIELERMKLDGRGGDLVNYLMLFREYIKVPFRPAGARIAWCRKRMLRYRVMEEAANTMRNLTKDFAAAKDRATGTGKRMSPGHAPRSGSTAPCTPTSPGVQEAPANCQGPNMADEGGERADTVDREQSDVPVAEMGGLAVAVAVAEAEAAADDDEAGDGEDAEVESEYSNIEPAKQMLVRRAVCGGYFMNVAQLGADGRYKVLRLGEQAYVDRSSLPTTHTAPPPFVVYLELIKTNKEYIKAVSEVELDWIKECSRMFYDDLKLDSKSNTIANFEIGPLPNAIIKHICGKHGDTMFGILRDLGASMTITPPPERCAVTCPAHARAQVTAFLTSRFDMYTRWVKESGAVRTVRGTCLAFGPGLAVVGRLGLGETRTMSLTSLPADATYDDLRMEVEGAVGRYAKQLGIRPATGTKAGTGTGAGAETGAEAHIIEFILNHDKSRATVTCNVDVRRLACELDGHVIKGRAIACVPSEAHGAAAGEPADAGFHGFNTVQVSWPLVPHNGNAEVQLGGPVTDSFIKERLYARGKGNVWPQVCGQVVGMFVYKDRRTNREDPTRIIVNKIPAHATDNDVINGLRETAGALPSILSASLMYPRPKPQPQPKATAQDPTEAPGQAPPQGSAPGAGGDNGDQNLDLVVVMLKSYFEQFGRIARIDVGPDLLSGGQAHLSIEYETPDEAMAAQRGAQPHVPVDFLGTKPMTVRLQPTCTIYLPGNPRIYDKITHAMDDAVKQVAARYPAIDVRRPERKPNTIRMSNKNVSVSPEEIRAAFVDARALFRKHMHYRVMRLPQEMRFSEIYRVNDESPDAALAIDRHWLVVMGASREAVAQAIEKLRTSPSAHAEQDGRLATRTFQIDPPVAVWYAREGKAEVKDKVPGAKVSVGLRGNRYALTVVGAADDITEVNLLLGEKAISIAEQKARRRAQGQGQDGGLQLLECGTCLVATPQDSAGLVLTCGHYTCHTCLELQMKQDTTSYPLRCSTCGAHMACEEILDHSTAQPQTKDGALEKSLDLLMLSENALGHCQECREGLYYKEDPRPVCSMCKEVLCSMCGSAAHPHMCAGEMDELDALVSDKMKKCPHCHRLNERNGGCNGMRCAYCQGQWCWLCLRGFPHDAHRHFGEKGDPCYGKCFEGCDM